MLKNYIDIYINKNRTIKCNEDRIGKQGENNVTQFRIHLEDEMIDKGLYVDFQKQDGIKITSPRLYAENNVAIYNLPLSLLDSNGDLKIEIILRTDEETWITYSRTFYVEKSINAVELIPEKEDWMCNAQKVLEDIEDGLTPTIGKNGNWFVGNHDTGTHAQGIKGENGEDAKINGVNSIILEAGDNIEIEQDGKKTIIKSTVRMDVKDVKVNDTSVLDENKIAQIDLTDYAKTREIPTKVSELENDSNYATKSEIPTKTSELTNDSDFAKTNTNNNFTSAQTINGTLTINGDIVQNGSSYDTHAEELFTKNDIIKTRDGAVGGLSEGELTGLEAINYDGENNGRLAFDNEGVARVGDVGDEQPLLTREETSNLTDGQVLVWDSTNLKAKGSSDYVKNTDYASTTKGGVIKVQDSFGTRMNSNGILFLERASNSQINDRNNLYNPIVSGNLDYAVKAALCDGKGTAYTEPEQANARERLGINQAELIETITLTEDTFSIERSTEPDGTAYNFKELNVVVLAKAVSENTNVSCQCKINGSTLSQTIGSAMKATAQTFGFFYDGINYGRYPTGSGQIYKAYIADARYFIFNGRVTYFKLNSGTSTIYFPTGTTILVFGVRA